jgi:DNA polymerase eta
VATCSETNPEPVYRVNPNPRDFKVSLDSYRKASRQVLEIISLFDKDYERASIDEVYLDLTSIVLSNIMKNRRFSESENKAMMESWASSEKFGTLINYSPNSIEFSWDLYMLFIASEIVSQIRSEIYKSLRFTCSAGVAHNKTLAKICSSQHKPNKQTILPQFEAARFLKNFPLTKIPMLGGKKGAHISQLFGANTCGDLQAYSPDQISKLLNDEDGSNWLYNICRGICRDEGIGSI